MKYLKPIKEKIWVLGIVLLIIAILPLSRVYFISTVAQNIFYAVDIILTILTIFILPRQYPVRIHHGFLFLINLLLIIGVFLNYFIAVPLLLIFPLFWSKKSHWAFKIFSVASYVLLILLVMLVLFVDQIFSSTKTLMQVDSPNNKYILEVISIDDGALGGATNVRISKKYFNTFKREETTFTGGYGKAKEVKWLNNARIKIDEKILDINLDARFSEFDK